MPKTDKISLRTRILRGLGGFGIGAMSSLLFYYFLTRDLLRPIRNPYLRTASGVGLGLFGFCLSPVMMLVFGVYGARLGAEIGAEAFFNLVKGMLDSLENKPSPAPKEAAQSTTELAFLLQKDKSAEPTITAANVITFPGGSSPTLYAKTSTPATRSKTELHIDTCRLTP